MMSGADVATGTFVLMVFAAGAAAAVLVVLAIFALRRAGESGMTGMVWGGGLLLISVLLASLLVSRSPGHDTAAERAAIESRAFELTTRAIAPGSALSCLDAVANTVVEIACEKALFASPEAVAAAVAYVDARYSLLAASVALAERDPGYRSTLQRLRHGIEEDRFGLVAHVLSTRGCNTSDCTDLALLHDTTRVLANMKTHAFENRVGAHALAWNSIGAAGPVAMSQPLPSSSSLEASLPSITTGIAPAMPAAPSTAKAPGPGRYDYPSAESIPAVSIMSAEPGPAPAAETKPVPPKRPTARRQTSREQAPAAPAPVAAPQPPAPQTSGSR